MLKELIFVVCLLAAVCSCSASPAEENDLAVENESDLEPAESAQFGYGGGYGYGRRFGRFGGGYGGFGRGGYGGFGRGGYGFGRGFGGYGGGGFRRGFGGYYG